MSWIGFLEPSAIVTKVSAMKQPHQTVVSSVQVPVGLLAPHTDINSVTQGFNDPAQCHSQEFA
jgi:hypothetical protein